MSNYPFIFRFQTVFKMFALRIYLHFDLNEIFRCPFLSSFKTRFQNVLYLYEFNISLISNFSTFIQRVHSNMPIQPNLLSAPSFGKGNAGANFIYLYVCMPIFARYTSSAWDCFWNITNATSSYKYICTLKKDIVYITYQRMSWPGRLGGHCCGYCGISFIGVVSIMLCLF